MVGVAALLPLGAWAAVTVDPGPATTVVADGRVGAAGTGAVGLLDEPSPTTTVPVANTAPTVPRFPGLPTTVRPAPTIAPPRATTTTVAAPVPRPTTTVPARPPGNIPPASEWRADVPGLSVRVRIDPAQPVAGQPVHFRIDVTSVDKCCHVFVNPGNDDMWILHNQLICSFEHELTPGAHTYRFDRTYAEPGAYLANVKVHDGSMCELPATGPPFRHIELPACIAVGPGDAAVTGCRPAPNPFPSLAPPPA
jgi:hypothetical protein